MKSAAYPETATERDAWILARRGLRPEHDPRQPHAYLVEEERTAAGPIVPILTLFLVSRECPWRCLMCDLWKFTVDTPLPAGAISEQIRRTLRTLPKDLPERRPRQTKLYNAGSFFDPRAIPPRDYPAIAGHVAGMERVVVECHPAFVGKRCLEFRDRLRASGGQGDPPAELEVAMGLETVHSTALARLNKRMTVDDFRRASDFLREHNIALRVFVLVRPPFLTGEREALEWAQRSIDFAFDRGATAVCLIPTRFGNGSLEALAGMGHFKPPSLAMLETAHENGLGSQRGRVFADLWDLEAFSRCTHCFGERRARLRRGNLTQALAKREPCPVCGE